MRDCIKQSKGKKEMNSLADRAFLQQVRDFVDQSGESSDNDNSEQKRVTKFKGYKQSVPVEDSALRQAQTAHTIQVGEIQEFTQLNNRRYNQLKEIVTNNPSQLEKQKVENRAREYRMREYLRLEGERTKGFLALLNLETLFYLTNIMLMIVLMKECLIFLIF